MIALAHQRGMHDIEHQITYEGSNFVFHDSQGFESGAKEEIDVVWGFIQKLSAALKLEDQLHAIWYFGIFLVILITKHAPIGTVYQWTVLAPSCLQNLSSLIKEQGKVSYPVVQSLS